MSTGSLGMGLGYGNGIALAKRMDGLGGRVYVVLGDGAVGVIVIMLTVDLVVFSSLIVILITGARVAWARTLRALKRCS